MTTAPGGPLHAWSNDAAPSLSGRTAVVTGVTGGLGQQLVSDLARRGARVLATARDEARGRHALDLVRADVPGADLDLVVLDLADLTSVRAAGAQVLATAPRIDIAVNNAGVMAPARGRTADGFELQMGTNHLGHFAWTGVLWPALAATGARVVAVSSVMHRYATGVPAARLRRDDGSAPYRRWRAYSESKLANLIWAVELDRRVRAAGLNVTAVAAHPGYSSTELIHSGPRQGSRIVAQGLRLVTALVSQSAQAGAWPLSAAATTSGLPGGSYVGPGGLGELRGWPTLVGMASTAQDPALAATVWELSEQATGMHYPGAASSAA